MEQIDFAKIGDWSDMLPTGRYAYPYRIQWSPTGHVRAKHNDDSIWKTAKCCNAIYAETIGYELLRVR